MMKTRWNTITPSQYPWERAALDLVRAGLPDHEPYRAWANFEFQAPDGAIYEVDLLVLTKQGFWLVEIKSRRGRPARGAHPRLPSRAIPRRRARIGAASRGGSRGSGAGFLSSK